MKTANGGADVADLGAAVGSYRRSVLDALWETVPAEMRSTRLSPKALSAEYSGAFIWSASHGFTIDLSLLPVTMRRELSWCMFRIVERGGRIALANMAMFARWLGNAVADLGSGAPSSLTGLSVQDWEHQFALSVQHRRNKLPAVSTRQTFRQYLTNYYRLLEDAYDPRPWWRRDVWNPTIDGRIPLRLHEPVGRHAAHFERIGTLWLRGGLQWHCKLGLETGSLTWTTVLQRISGLVVFDYSGVTTKPNMRGNPAQKHVVVAHLKPVMQNIVGEPRGEKFGQRHGQRVASLALHDGDRLPSPVDVQQQARSPVDSASKLMAASRAHTTPDAHVVTTSR